MNVAEFEAFLKDSGNSYEIEELKDSKRVWFRDRGNTFCGYPSETDSSFLYLTIDLPIPSATTDLERLTDVMNEIEDEYKLVKLKSFPKNGDDGPFIRVATEQLAANADAAAAIFWRSIDLMRSAGFDCRKRLLASPQTVSNNDSAAFVSGIEKALESGCDSNSDLKLPSNKLRAALALVLDSSNGTGSAFCVASSKDVSLYLTNAHVVESFETVTLYRQCPNYVKMIGTVIAKGDHGGPDLAIVSVPVGSIEPVTMSSAPPKRDEPICLLGYARVQIWAAKETGELQAASHLGTITSVNRNGTEILHDALSRPGNSGGPLFAPSSGLVYGVQRGGWQEEEEGIAIGQAAILKFLAQHHVEVSR